jgi:hypothetical protein
MGPWRGLAATVFTKLDAGGKVGGVWTRAISRCRRRGLQQWREMRMGPRARRWTPLAPGAGVGGDIVRNRRTRLERPKGSDAHEIERAQGEKYSSAIHIYRKTMAKLHVI